MLLQLISSVAGPWSMPSVEARLALAVLFLHAGPALALQMLERSTGNEAPVMQWSWPARTVTVVAMGYAMLWFGELGGRQFVYFAF